MNLLLFFLLIIIVVLMVFCGMAFYKINQAHKEQFRRAAYDSHSFDWLFTYTDFASQYPRETLLIPSGQNNLTAFLYGVDNKNGLIIISSGHRNATEVELQDMKYFVDNGWMVLCYDYTGYYNSGGKNMIDYIQSVKDLDAVLSFLENSDRFREIPFLLYGHSLGAYASAAVLRFQHRISAAVIASGFDKPVEQWSYSVKRFTGSLGTVLGVMAGVYLRIVFGKDTIRLSAIDGINSSNIPILIISGVDDEYYGGKSPIYIKKNKITNPNCSYMLMDKEKHNGHYDYMLTDKALDYQRLWRDNRITSVDKRMIMEQDMNYFHKINAFFLSALHY